MTARDINGREIRVGDQVVSSTFQDTRIVMSIDAPNNVDGHGAVVTLSDGRQVRALVAGLRVDNERSI